MYATVSTIGTIAFTDGSECAVYEREDGTQFVYDNDQPVPGIWRLLPEPPACDAPIIVYPDGAPPFRRT